MQRCALHLSRRILASPLLAQPAMSTKVATIYEKVSSVEALTEHMTGQMLEVGKVEKKKEVTTADMLRACSSLDQVLQLCGVVGANERSADADLLKCFQALNSYDDRCERVLNNQNFHTLLGLSIKRSSRMPSTVLSKLYVNLVKLDVPKESNVMRIMRRVVMIRVNDFFPSDVVTCLRVPLPGEMFKTLRMHMLNVAGDERFFHDCACRMSIPDIGFMLRLSWLSYEHKHTIAHACAEQLRSKQSLTLDEALTLLGSLAHAKNRNKFLLRTAARRILDDRHILTFRKRVWIERALKAFTPSEIEGGKFGPLDKLSEIVATSQVELPVSRQLLE